MSRRVRCPGCNGDMDARSQVCRFCRRRALELGIRAVLEQAAGPRPRVTQITPGQIRAFYGKAHALAQMRSVTTEDVHDLMLEWATTTFIPPASFKSVKELDELQANDVLTHMAGEIARSRRAVDAPEEESSGTLS